MGKDIKTEAQSLPAVAGQVELRVRRLPPKVMGEFPGMSPVEKLEADFRRLAAGCRAIHAQHGHEKSEGMALAYIAAAEKVRRLRCVMTPNRRAKRRPR